MKNKIFNMITALLSKDTDTASNISREIFSAKSKNILEGKKTVEVEVEDEDKDEVEVEVEVKKTKTKKDKVS